MVEDIRKSVSESPYFKSFSETRREAFVQLAAFIREAQKQYHVHGHGVLTEGEAESIEQGGLYTLHTTLQKFTYPLDRDERVLARQITQWPFEGRQFIVLIAVPLHEEYVASDDDDRFLDESLSKLRSQQFAREHVLERHAPPVNIDSFAPNAQRRVPPSKIIGYWDEKKGALHVNPEWQKVQVL